MCIALLTGVLFSVGCATYSPGCDYLPVEDISDTTSTPFGTAEELLAVTEGQFTLELQFQDGDEEPVQAVFSLARADGPATFLEAVPHEYVDGPSFAIFKVYTLEFVTCESVLAVPVSWELKTEEQTWLGIDELVVERVADEIVFRTDNLLLRRSPESPWEGGFYEDGILAASVVEVIE